MTYQAKWMKDKYHNDPEFRQRKLEYQRQFYKEHKPQVLEQRRARYRKDPKKVVEYQKKRYREDPQYREKVKRLAIDRTVKREHLARLQLIEELGGQCEVCHTCDQQVLVVHHPNGRKDVKWKSSTSDFRAFKKGSIPLMLLCANCHMRMHNQEKNKKAYS